MPPSPKKSARFVAITTLCELDKNRKPVNGIFASVLNRYPLENNDRQLANNIISGLLRNRDSLDMMLQHLCKQPLKKFDPFVLQALRVGLFQIIHLDRIPESAAVNESVKAVQAARLPKRLHGFVNGVLRNSIRKKEELLALLPPTGSQVLNHPKWLTRRWEKRYGKDETARICIQNNIPAAVTLQINTLATDLESFRETLLQNGIQCHPGEYSKDALILDGFHGKITGIPGFTEGLFQVQDQGAQLLAHLIGPMTKGGEYLDACAGVGGKTSVLLQMAKDIQAKVSALEPDKGRREKFADNMQRLHPQSDIQCFPGTLQEFATSSTQRFHGILLDSPCSGTGVIRRHPDIRWNRRVNDFKTYQQTQLELLHTAAKLLHPRGIIVYATCSLEKEENEQVLEHFLVAHKNFVLDACTTALPTRAHGLLNDNVFSPLPGPEIDGFFGARLNKKVVE